MGRVEKLKDSLKCDSGNIFRTQRKNLVRVIFQENAPLRSTIVGNVIEASPNVVL